VCLTIKLSGCFKFWGWTKVIGRLYTFLNHRLRSEAHLVNLLLLIVIKALVGGTAVVAFAALGELLRPRGLAGIFAAAPSVALASLAVTSVASGSSSAMAQAVGMVAGAAALLVACLVGIEAVKRLGTLRGSLGAVALWLLVGLSLGSLVLR
jgi:hypothetical protein